MRRRAVPVGAHHRADPRRLRVPAGRRARGLPTGRSRPDGPSGGDDGRSRSVSPSPTTTARSSSTPPPRPTSTTSARTVPTAHPCAGWPGRRRELDTTRATAPGARSAATTGTRPPAAARTTAPEDLPPHELAGPTRPSTGHAPRASRSACRRRRRRRAETSGAWFHETRSGPAPPDKKLGPRRRRPGGARQGTISLVRAR